MVNKNKNNAFKKRILKVSKNPLLIAIDSLQAPPFNGTIRLFFYLFPRDFNFYQHEQRKNILKPCSSEQCDP